MNDSEPARSVPSSVAVASVIPSGSDTVAFLMDTCPDWIWTTLALNKLGAIWVPINGDYKGTWLSEAIEESKGKVLVMARGRAVAQGTVAELCARTGHDDFERCFVQLAFGSAADAAEAVR